MSAALRAALERAPRVALAQLPTPIEPMERLARALGGGAELWIKRDDCTGLAFGGNKVRKLEYLVAEALAAGADTLITTGGVQSNHARQTAAAAAKLGLACELVLPRLVAGREAAYETSGNRLLDEWLGARVRIVARGADVAPAVDEIEAQISARAGSAFFIPAGGSTPTGCLGYARAALELAEQIAAGVGPRPDAIVLAVSSGGTLAGLLAGLEALGLPIPVIAVSVYAPGAKVAPVVRALADATCAFLDTPPVPDTRLDLRDDWLGPGYGLPTEDLIEALGLAARSEGLLLDPVYTGKAFSGLISLIRQGKFAERRVLFWHTGGAPGLFAYPELAPKK